MRRKIDAARWTKWGAYVAAVSVVIAAYFVVAHSEPFALKNVEIDGNKRVSRDRLEALARKAAGPRLLDADLGAVCDALEHESYVRSVSVVRVLPDTLRIHVEEREPTVVVRLKGGKLGWVDADGHLLDNYAPQSGETMPPPLKGYEDDDTSERASADNHDRVARYLEIREALSKVNMWDTVDEVDLRYLNDVRLELADNGIVVRVGDKDYAARLAKARRVVEAARQGDTATLAQFGLADISKVIASAEMIDGVDAASATGRLTILWDQASGSRPSAQPAAPYASTPPSQSASPAPQAAPPQAEERPSKPSAIPSGRAPEPSNAASDTSAAAAKPARRSGGAKQESTERGKN